MPPPLKMKGFLAEVVRGWNERASESRLSHSQQRQVLKVLVTQEGAAFELSTTTLTQSKLVQRRRSIGSLRSEIAGTTIGIDWEVTHASLKATNTGPASEAIVSRIAALETAWRLKQLVRQLSTLTRIPGCPSRRTSVTDFNVGSRTL
jgi:hypothetical protein